MRLLEVSFHICFNIERNKWVKEATALQPQIVKAGSRSGNRIWRRKNMEDGFLFKYLLGSVYFDLQNQILEIRVVFAI